MRIGILTASRTDNIGTDLQAYAMQCICSKLSSKVEIINYRCIKLENSRKFFYPHSLKGLLSIPYNIVKHFNHQKFRNKYFHYSDEIYSNNNLLKLPYDAVIVGSDQIWNLSITGCDMGFFLPFHGVNFIKASYAASLGRTDLHNWEDKHHISAYLSDFKSVSVREKSGVNALAEIGITASWELDPLLMISGTKWKEISVKPKTSRKYIVIYVVDRTKDAVKYGIEYGQKNNMDIYFFGNPIKPIKGVKVKRFVSIEEWLGYFANAELIITNSYHGLSMAIGFHKKIVCFKLQNYESNSRLETALLYLGYNSLNDAVIYDPDWDNVELSISKMRLNSMIYLRNIVGERIDG